MEDKIHRINGMLEYFDKVVLKLDDEVKENEYLNLIYLKQALILLQLIRKTINSSENFNSDNNPDSNPE